MKSLPREALIVCAAIAGALALGATIDAFQEETAQRQVAPLVLIGLGLLFEVASIGYYWFGKSGFPVIAPILYFIELIQPGKVFGYFGFGTLETFGTVALLFAIHVAIHGMLAIHWDKMRS